MNDREVYESLLTRATEMWGGDKAKADLWLKSPAYAFRGISPLEHATTQTGYDEVVTLIARILHGIPT